MLPKVHRLRYRNDFSRVYREGLRRNSRHLTLWALQISAKPACATPAPRGLSPNGQQFLKRKEKFSEGDRVSLPHSFLPFDCKFPTQIGISISTKVSKRATIRNRIKRQIKAAMFQILPLVSSGWLIIISVRPGAIECDYWQFLRELEQMIKRLR